MAPSTLLLLSVASMAVAAVTDPYLAPMADSYIARGVGSGFGYSEATLYTGIEGAYAASGDETVADWYQGQIDAIVDDDGR